MGVGSLLPTPSAFYIDSPNGLVYDADMSNGRIAASSFFFFFTSREGVAVSLLK